MREPTSVPPHSPGEASAWVRHFAAGIPAAGRVLDVACGGGRHMSVALSRGASVLGIDRDIGEASRRFAGNAAVALIAADLETGQPPPFRGRTFAGVVVTNYLWRPLFPDIVAAVAEDGLLIYETFMAGHERLGRPRNPDFLLRRGELAAVVASRLVMVAFEEVRLAAPDRLVQRIAAVGARHPWAGVDAPLPFGAAAT